jgi:hypothetical protein
MNACNLKNTALSHLLICIHYYLYSGKKINILRTTFSLLSSIFNFCTQIIGILKILNKNTYEHDQSD